MSDLRVALRFQAHAGNTRREVQQLERDLRQAGKNGAKALSDEANKAGAVVNKAGREGAASYRIIRQAMREAATQGAGVLRQDVIKTQAELKQLGLIGRQAAKDAKAELVRTDREGMQPLARSVNNTDNALRRMAQNGGRNLRALKTIAAGVRSEFDRLKGFGSSTMGQLAGFGVGVGAAASLKNSAMLDRQLIRTQQTAGMTTQQRDEWRQEGQRIGSAYGVDPAAIYTGGDALLAGGLSYAAVKASADAMGQASAVTAADPAILADALMSGAAAFNIDLEKGGAALDMLQKMTVAGRLGRAELENLSDIFPKIGGDAQAAGMSLEQSLAFVETLSATEGAPDRLGTLAASTLRMFTNPQYRDQITKATGLSYYNKDGSTRSPLTFLQDIGTQYGRLTTDKERAKYMGTVFKGMDQDLLRGVRYLLSDGVLGKFASHTQAISEGAPVFNKDLADNIGSASGTAGRMRSVLGGAIDRMAQPLNKSFADFGTYLLDDLNLSGEQMLAGAVGTGVAGYYAGRGAKAGAGSLLNKFLGGTDTLKNLAVGKVLEEATGVQSVFVTNWPAAGLAGGIDLPETGDKPNKKPPARPSPSNNRVSNFGKLVGLLELTKRFGPAGFVVGSSLLLSGASGAQDDAARLAMVPRDKSLTDGQKTYQEAFYRNRIALADEAPEDLSYGERQTWLNDNAQRLAHQQTGLTSQGQSIADAKTWASDLNNRLRNAISAKPVTGLELLDVTHSQQFRDDVQQITRTDGVGAWAGATAARLDNPPSPLAGQPGLTPDVAGAVQGLLNQIQSLVGQPLVIEVRTDSDMIYADVERRAGIQARRGQ
ncbi:Phage-related minor tail protein (modular protein) [Pseudomonas sp. 8Z]|uniref:phage tail tape measure protein n=1 Tax=Pseudomonas sp. 8Z TaxID=2653166 RepID=UPI0012F308D2|nr:phage tail tape measure protein [Pseudomonas sp. 8Z]VXC71813.1 Phage-related minor tail protein (modular protein) [Pseudomonas sp. 8Z]